MAITTKRAKFGELERGDLFFISRETGTQWQKYSMSFAIDPILYLKRGPNAAPERHKFEPGAPVFIVTVTTE